MPPKGWKSSEFWVSLATASIPLMNQAFGWHLQPSVIMPIVALSVSYVLSRTAVKVSANLPAATTPVSSSTLADCGFPDDDGTPSE